MVYIRVEAALLGDALASINPSYSVVGSNANRADLRPRRRIVAIIARVRAVVPYGRILAIARR